MTPSKSKKNSGCVGFFLLTLLAIGGGYYYGKKLFLGSELSLQSSNKILPESTLGNTFISTNEEKWSKLAEFSTPETKKIIEQNWQELVNDNLGQKNQNIDYQKDILPWLDGISLAILPSSEAGINYNSVAILGVKNKLKANSFFEKFKKNNPEKPIETKYQNITVYQINNDSNQIFLTFFNNYLVMSDKESVIHQIIDTYKGGVSLADSSSHNITANNGIFQVYLPDYSNLFFNIIKDSLPEVETEKSALKQLEKIDSITMNLSVENHGLKLRSVVNLSEPIASAQKFKPVTTNLVGKIPDNTICMMTGGGINLFWQQINQEKQNIPELDSLINQAKMATRQGLNLDLDKDIFSWLDGEFVLALLPSNSTNFNEILNGLLILESSTKTQGETTFRSLENTAKLLPFIQINQNNIGGIDVTQWSNTTQTLLSYGWLNNNHFLMTFIGNFEDIKNIEKSNSLLENDTFKLTTESLEKTNNGYFYCNVKKTLNLAQNLDPNFWDSSTPEFKAFADSIQGFAVTNSLINPTTNQVDLNISLAKNEK